MSVQQRLSLPLYLAGSRHMRILGVLQRDLLMLECGRNILGLIQLRITLLCSSWQMLKTLTWRLSAVLKLLSPCYLWIIFRATWEISAPLLIMPRPATALIWEYVLHHLFIFNILWVGLRATFAPPSICRKHSCLLTKIYYSWADWFWGQSLVYVHDARREQEFCWNFADLSSFLVIWRVVMCFIVDYSVPWQLPS